MNHIANAVRLSQVKMKIYRCLLIAAALATWGSFIGCTTVGEQLAKPEPVQAQKQPQLEYLQRSKALFAEGKYEAALKENQRALAEGRGAPDAALFNIGFICAYSQNPKKDHPKALQSFKTLVSQHPQSPFAEQGKVWILVLEEHQKISEERHRLAEEKRAVNKEREVLAQEREKLKYTVEKSRQVDIEIERRRRRSLNR
jgi:tetratricopeptide (TPR) repeat protein